MLSRRGRPELKTALPPHPKQVPPAAQVRGRGAHQNVGALERTQGTQGTGPPEARRTAGDTGAPGGGGATPQ